MAIPVSTQVNFGLGLNASIVPHLLQEGEVQSGSNVDFSLEQGAAASRRGSLLWSPTSSSTSSLNVLGRNYNGSSTSLDTSPWYAISQNGPFLRGTISGGSSINFGSINGTLGTATSSPSFITSYQNYTYLANGSTALRDNGGNTWTWVVTSPISPPVSVTVIGNQFVGFGGTFTASVGTVLSSSTATGSGWYLTTATTGVVGTAGTGIVLVGTTGTNTNWENPNVTTQTGTGAPSWGIGHHGTYTYSVGAFGTDYLLMGLNNPGGVTRVSRDLSVGDTTFSNYWHAETDLSNISPSSTDPIAQTLSITANANLTQISRPVILSKTFVSVPKPSQTLSSFPTLISNILAWGVARTDYEFIGSSVSSPTWTNIQAVRVIVECSEPTAVVFGGWQTYGDTKACLTDENIGYSYAYTRARLEGGFPVVESGPSPFTLPVKCQDSFSEIVVGFDTALTTDGATHVGIYRQGGVLNDAYLVDYYPINNGGTPNNSIYWDAGYADVEIVNNSPLVRNLWGTWSGATAISEPWQDRIFIGSNNQLWWSAPGAPSSIQNDVQTTVSISGDPIQGFVPWGNLVIVNQNSVYEMTGSIFEGANTDWSIQKSGSRRGSAAPKTIIRTPQGILLFGYDGMSLYYPGFGIDTPLSWVYDKVGDMWRGTKTTDPSHLKGDRVPPLNLPYIGGSVATYMDGKIYLAAPTGSSQSNNTVFVFDLHTQRVWYYVYPFNISSLFWDFVGNRLMAGTLDGSVVQLEVGLLDSVPSSSSTQMVPWVIRTKTWTSPTNLILEGGSVECEALGGIDPFVIMDGGSPYRVGTFTNSLRMWNPISIQGTVANNVCFQFSGTQGSSSGMEVSGLQWNGIQQPPFVTYWRSDFDEAGFKGEKIWDSNSVEISIPGTGTVIGVTFVDNLPVMTNTYLGPTSGANYAYEYQTNTSTFSGPVLVPRSYPSDGYVTYGNISYSTFTSSIPFQIFGVSNGARPEPPRLTQYVSDKFSIHHLAGWKSDMEGFWHSVMIDMDTGWDPRVNGSSGAIQGQIYIDETPVGGVFYIQSEAGEGRNGYKFTLPSETYGNVAYIKYTSQNGIPFKHYSTYWDVTPEPTRAVFFEEITEVPSSEVYVKTWLAELNCLGQTVVGTLIVDGSNVITNTFTGSLHKTYEVAVPNITSGKSIKAIYRSYTQEGYGYEFKKYKTSYEFEPKPFTKTNWLLTYKRPGGVTQMDMARFCSEDLEGTATVTSTWFADSVAVLSNTLTLSGRKFFDSLSFPPGVRGYLFQQQLSSPSPFKVWRSNLDIERIGVKGFSRVTYHGKPQEGPSGGGG